MVHGKPENRVYRKNERPPKGSLPIVVYVLKSEFGKLLHEVNELV